MLLEVTCSSLFCFESQDYFTKTQDSGKNPWSTFVQNLYSIPNVPPQFFRIQESRQCSDFAIRPTVRYKFDFDKSLHIASAADLDTVPLQVLLATVAATLHSAADLDTEPQGGNYFLIYEMTTIIFDSAEGAYDNWPKGTSPKLSDHFQLLDILQLVSHSGRKLALVHLTEGFAWFRLDAIIAAAPIIFDEYVAWYMSRYDIHPLDELSSGSPSPPRPILSPPVQEFDSSDTDSEQLLPASPYGSADIVLVYSAAILSGSLDILRHDWLAFLDDEKYEDLQEQLGTKVRLMLFWQRFKACSSFWKSKKFAILRKQRAVTRSWYTWRDQAGKSASIRSVLSVIRFSLVQTAFSKIRDSAQLARHISFV